MADIGATRTGQFFWVDLAATDAGRAQAFYGQMFGWTAESQAANGGVFTRLKLDGRDIGSLYQLQSREIEAGAPSHWTPYVLVDDLEAATRRARELGGEVLVDPFLVEGVARIALILDAVGAPLGLWEPLAPDADERDRP